MKLATRLRGMAAKHAAEDREAEGAWAEQDVPTGLKTIICCSSLNRFKSSNAFMTHDIIYIYNYI